MSNIKGFIQAATSDNVQPLALHACEQLGTILPVSNTITRIKIERLAGRKQNQPLSFVKAQIGFCAGDSADILAKTEGGLRFLCFAAILLSYGGADLESAELLEIFLSRRSSTEQPRPTLLQLLDLLRAIKPKLVDAGFLKVVMGWRDWCVAKGPPELQGLLSYHRPLFVPLRTGVCDFITVLSQSYRVGRSVRVECSMTFIPWIIATVKWMFGSPPNVWRSDGSQLLQSDLAGVSIVEVDGDESSRYWAIIRLLLKDFLNHKSFLERDGNLAAANTTGGMQDMQTWSNHHLQTIDIHLSPCRQLVYMITKPDIPRMCAVCTTMEKKVQRHDMLHAHGSLPTKCFLSAFRQITNLPQKDTDIETLLEESKN